MKMVFQTITCFLIITCLCVFEGICGDLDSLQGKRIKDICDDLEKIRGLPFKKEVKTDIQTPEAFKSYVFDAMDRQYGEGGADAYVKGLVKLGLLKKFIDLEETLADLFQSEAAAHYDPQKDTYYLLMTNSLPMVLDVISSHELCHALQDQQFDLFNFLEKDVEYFRRNGDAAMARQSIVEGEATLVMTMWTVMDQWGIKDLKTAGTMASSAVGTQAAMDYETIMKLVDTQKALMGGIGFSSGAEKEFPRFFMEMVYAQYMQGAQMVDFVRSKYGWEGVSNLYTNPPQSTEQVLHPHKLLGERDMPIDVDLSVFLKKDLSDEWKVVEEDVLGELGVRVFLGMWQNKDARDYSAVASAAQGWGGDRYYYFEDQKANKDLLMWNIVWDTSGDATEFAIAYRLALMERFPRMKKVMRAGKDADFAYQVWEVEPGRFLKLASKDKVIGIIDSTDRKMLDILWN